MSALHSALRAATADLHARLDAWVSGQMGDGRLAYARYLRGMHAFMRAAVGVVPARADWNALVVDLSDDLDALGLQPLPGARMAPAVSQAACMGWEYVIEGSTLGARLLLRDATALGFDAGRGAAFLSRHAADGRRWPRFLATLEHLAGGDPDFVARACDGARDAFLHAEAAMRAACANEP